MNVGAQQAQQALTQLEETPLKSANLQGADLRTIPWLIVMDLMMQPAINTDGILWDGMPHGNGSEQEDVIP